MNEMSARTAIQRDLSASVVSGSSRVRRVRLQPDPLPLRDRDAAEGLVNRDHAREDAGLGLRDGILRL